MFKAIVLFVTLIAACAGELVHPKATASIKNTHFNGLDGLNLHLTIPYKYEDYVFGVKHTISNDLKKLPDAFYAKKSFPTPLDGTVAVDAHFTLADQTLHVDAEWSSAKHGVTAVVRADSSDHLTKVKLTKTQALPNDLKLTLCSGYNVVKNVFCGSATVNNEATTVRLEADSAAQDPVLSVSHNIDENTEVSPSISLRSGAMSYGFTRRWLGGSAKANLVLNDKVTVEWKDNGASGVWTTTAAVPLNGDKPSVSFAREWVY